MSASTAPDFLSILKSRNYLALVVLGGIVGIPVAAASYFFLQAVARLQKEIYTDLPRTVGFHSAPLWWPIPWLVLAGFIVALAIEKLPGTAGHEPSAGLQAGGGPVSPVDLYGIVIAAFATLTLGAVLGPEAPLIALGSGLGVLAVQLVKKGAPAQASLVIGTAGSFAAIATLLGSPLVGAFLLMEMAGLGGPMMEVILIPGLLAAGVGSLIFVGLNSLSGLGPISLTVSGIPRFTSPTGGEFLWALVIGAFGAIVATAIFRVARLGHERVSKNRLVFTPLAGLAVALLAIVFEGGTGHGSSWVLFSGQSALPNLIRQTAGWTVGALVLLLVCKAVAYCVSLSGFRGGPIFPAMFIGAAGGVALSHLPGLPMIAGAAMGIGAMVAAALKMPMTAVLLPSVLFVSDSIELMPLVIVAVVVSYIVAARLTPTPAPTT